MVITSRLSWLYGELQLGRACRFSCNTHHDRINVQIVLQPISAMGTSDNLYVLGFVDVLMQGVCNYAVVDHGHQHTDGTSRISISIKPRGVQKSPAPVESTTFDKVIITQQSECHEADADKNIESTNPTVDPAPTSEEIAMHIAKADAVIEALASGATAAEVAAEKDKAEAEMKKTVVDKLTAACSGTLQDIQQVMALLDNEDFKAIAKVKWQSLKSKAELLVARAAKIVDDIPGQTDDLTNLSVAIDMVNAENMCVIDLRDGLWQEIRSVVTSASS